MRQEVRHVIMKRMKNDYRDNDYNYDERDSRRDYDDFDDDMRMHDSVDCYWFVRWYDAILIGGIILL